MNGTISLPKELLRKAEELAAYQCVSVEELVSAALSAQFSAIDYLRRRGERGDLNRFREALGQIPDTEAEPYDRID